jgi:hypothetical protein
LTHREAGLEGGGTGLSDRQTVDAFLGHVGTRARPSLAAVTPKGISSFRDAELFAGKGSSPRIRRKPWSCPWQPDYPSPAESDLPRAYCHDSGRHGALEPHELYNPLIPSLLREAKAALAVKDGKRKIYGIGTDDSGAKGSRLFGEVICVCATTDPSGSPAKSTAATHGLHVVFLFDDFGVTVTALAGPVTWEKPMRGNGAYGEKEKEARDHQRERGGWMAGANRKCMNESHATHGPHGQGVAHQYEVSAARAPPNFSRQTGECGAIDGAALSVTGALRRAVLSTIKLSIMHTSFAPAFRAPVSTVPAACFLTAAARSPADRRPGVVIVTGDYDTSAAPIKTAVQGTAYFGKADLINEPETNAATMLAGIRPYDSVLVDDTSPITNPAAN